MDPMKNHEGYRDPTAGRAVRNAVRRTRRGKDRASQSLTYRLGEIRMFQECAQECAQRQL